MGGGWRDVEVWLEGAVGSTTCGSIWTNSIQQAPAELLPGDALEMPNDITGNLDPQLTHEVGSPTRLAIEEAYGIAQKKMLIAGTAIMSLCIVCVLLIRNYNVRKMQQTKGRLF